MLTGKTCLKIHIGTGVPGLQNALTLGVENGIGQLGIRDFWRAGHVTICLC
jgi:hypothetical protein